MTTLTASPETIVKIFSLDEKSLTELNLELTNFFEKSDYICSYYDQNPKCRIIGEHCDWAKLAAMVVYDEFQTISREAIGVPTKWNFTQKEKSLELIIRPDRESSFYVEVKNDYAIYFVNTKLLIKFKQGKQTKIICFEKDR